ncbi:MAG: hypothetical protein RBR78_01285 [Flavobacteriaceae bacterium]|jgi:hypothetical protein|nr:hypothetical protein [Flavobacteriaceae bacterium]
MKNSISKLTGLAMLSVLAFTTSCSSDDDNGGNTSTFVLDQNNLKGEINDGTVVLEGGKTYLLTGKLQVNDGATLRIEAGAKIEATDVTSSTPEIRYIAVAQGGKINVQGTATNPVVMTSTTTQPGAWGGLVICGKAPINKATSASAEVSDLTYGGTDPNDSSGSIKYLRLEYTGYAYNSEKEFNGVSFFGVGNGTVVEYVQSYEGSDDQFEWFGGTVNAKYLVAINASTSNVGDDIFDWTEGWTGIGENWYGKRTNGGNRGIEADNNSSTHTATPISNPTIKNLTLIGSGSSIGNEDQAIKLRVGTKANFDNLVLSNWTVGFDVQHDAGISYVNDGTLKATRVKFDNVATKAVYSADVTQQIYSEDNTATGAGNGTGKPSWAEGWTVGF